MPDTIPVTIEVEAAAATVLADSHTRAAVGRLVSRVLHPRPGPSELAQAIAAARAAGLTDADIDAELDAHNAERRSAPAS